jgi:uncharacterized coiled-coil protein SlyX
MLLRVLVPLWILGMAVAFVTGAQTSPATANRCYTCPTPKPTRTPNPTIGALQAAVSWQASEIKTLSSQVSSESQQINALTAQVNALSARVAAMPTPTPRATSGLLGGLVTWKDLKTLGMSTGNYDNYLVPVYHQ